MSIEELDAILGKTQNVWLVSMLTHQSTYCAILKRTLWRLRICRIYWCLQRSRLLCCVFPLRSHGRLDNGQVHG
jgi:hypothetical protein